MMNFFTSVEFYIILAVVAAAIVAFAAKPGGHGPVLEYLLSGDLTEAGEEEQPTVDVTCLNNGTVLFVRKGLDNISREGAASLAVKVKGTDVSIEERLTTGKGELIHQQAEFVVKFLREGRYHVHYNSSKTGLFAAFPLHVTPGMSISKPLAR